MRVLVVLVVLSVIVMGLMFVLGETPFGANHIATSDKPGRHYIVNGVEETGAANTVTSVVVSYRGFDTLGEVAVLFIAAIGLGAVLYTQKSKLDEHLESASHILRTGCRFLFPLILLFGAYLFVHGHLTPGGGFQGGVVIASGFLLTYLGCAEMRVRKAGLNAVESLAGTVFVIAGLVGLALGGDFLMNFLPKGTANMLFSAGLIPIIYVCIGLKVGSELAGIVANLLERPE